MMRRLLKMIGMSFHHDLHHRLRRVVRPRLVRAGLCRHRAGFVGKILMTTPAARIGTRRPNPDSCMPAGNHGAGLLPGQAGRGSVIYHQIGATPIQRGVALPRLSCLDVSFLKLTARAPQKCAAGGLLGWV